MAGIDKRLQDVLYAEVGGGSPEEVAAVGSTFLNNADVIGYEKALKMSSAYNKKSREYLKAATGKMTPYEKSIYDRNAIILQNIIRNPDARQPWTNFENVKAFGNPYWAKDMESYKDIGRQRFYIKKANPRIKALKRR